MVIWKRKLLKPWRRTIEEEAEILERAVTEIMKIAGKKIVWLCLKKTKCFRGGETGKWLTD
jgi:hypothetical protein